MSRQITLKYFPDGTDTGKPVLLISLKVLNQKRYKSLSEEEREEALMMLENFEGRLQAFKQELLTNLHTQNG